MIGGAESNLNRILRHRDPYRFADAFVELYASFDSSVDFVRYSGSHIASSISREDYARFLPHSYLSFIAAARLGRYLSPEYHFRALGQALHHFKSEVIVRPRDFEQDRATAVRDLQSPSNGLSIEEACQEGDFDRFFQKFGADLRDANKREEAIRWLLEHFSHDLFNLGHKYIYSMKCLEMAEYAGWSTPGTYFYPSLHYSMVAPEDRSAAERIDQRLGTLDYDLNKCASDKHELSESEFRQIRDAVFFESEDAVIETLLGALDYGIDTRTLSEALLVSAAHLILAVPYDRWIFPIHGFTFSEAVFSSLRYHSPVSRRRLILAAGLQLRRIAASSMPFELKEPFFMQRPPEVITPLFELEEAIDVSIPADAMSAFDWLYKHGRYGGRLFELLAGAAAKNDPLLHFGHDLKLAYAALDAFHCCITPMREDLLLALVKFLSEGAKDREMDHALALGARIY